MTLHETAPHKRNQQARVKAERYRKKHAKWLKHHKPRHLTPGEKHAVRQKVQTGFFKKIGKFREAMDLPDTTNESVLKHPNAYISNILEWSADSKDPRDFTKEFLSKDPAYTNTNTGLAAMQFEAWMVENAKELFAKFLETEVDPNETTFYATFEGSLTPDDYAKMSEELSWFLEYETVVEAGTVDTAEGEVADFTIIECSVVKGAKLKKPNRISTDPKADEKPANNRKNIPEGVKTTDEMKAQLNLKESDAYISNGKVLWKDEASGNIYTLMGEQWFPEGALQEDEETDISTSGRWAIKQSEESAQHVAVTLLDPESKDSVTYPIEGDISAIRLQIEAIKSTYTNEEEQDDAIAAFLIDYGINSSEAAVIECGQHRTLVKRANDIVSIPVVESKQEWGTYHESTTLLRHLHEQRFVTCPDTSPLSEDAKAEDAKAHGLKQAHFIRDQIGHKARFMLGAKHETVDHGQDFTVAGHTTKGTGKPAHSMRIGKNAKGVNHVKTELNGDDTYDMTFGKIHGGKYTVKHKAEGVQVGEMHSTIEKHTGMRTSLGTVGHHSESNDTVSMDRARGTPSVVEAEAGEAPKPKQYNFSFHPGTHKEAKRISWKRSGHNMYDTHDLAKKAAQKDYPKAHGFSTKADESLGEDAKAGERTDLWLVSKASKTAPWKVISEGPLSLHALQDEVAKYKDDELGYYGTVAGKTKNEAKQAARAGMMCDPFLAAESFIRTTDYAVDAGIVAEVISKLTGEGVYVCEASDHYVVTFAEGVHSDTPIGAIYRNGIMEKLGDGTRFKDLTKKLSGRSSIKNPAALATAIGRKKYGAKKFNSLAHHHAEGELTADDFSVEDISSTETTMSGTVGGFVGQGDNAGKNVLPKPNSEMGKKATKTAKVTPANNTKRPGKDGQPDETDAKLEGYVCVNCFAEGLTENIADLIEEGKETFNDDELATIYRVKSEGYQITFEDWKAKHFVKADEDATIHTVVNHKGVAVGHMPAENPDDALRKHEKFTPTGRVGHTAITGKHPLGKPIPKAAANKKGDEETVRIVKKPAMAHAEAEGFTIEEGTVKQYSIAPDEGDHDIADLSEDDFGHAIRTTSDPAKLKRMHRFVSKMAQHKAPLVRSHYGKMLHAVHKQARKHGVELQAQEGDIEVEFDALMEAKNKANPFAKKGKAPEPATKDDDEPNTDENADDELEFDLEDVQLYYDMQIVRSVEEADAVIKVMEKFGPFGLTDLTVSPMGIVKSDDFPNEDSTDADDWQFAGEQPGEETPGVQSPGSVGAAGGGDKGAPGDNIDKGDKADDDTASGAGGTGNIHINIGKDGTTKAKKLAKPKAKKSAVESKFVSAAELTVEDKELIARLNKTPDRNVFVIDVGNATEADAKAFVKRLTEKVKGFKVIAGKSGGTAKQKYRRKAPYAKDDISVNHSNGFKFMFGPGESAEGSVDEAKLNDKDFRQFFVSGKSIVIDDVWWTIRNRDLDKDTCDLVVSDYAIKDGHKPGKKTVKYSSIMSNINSGKWGGSTPEKGHMGKAQDKMKRAALRKKNGLRAPPGTADKLKEGEVPEGFAIDTVSTVEESYVMVHKKAPTVFNEKPVSRDVLDMHARKAGGMFHAEMAHNEKPGDVHYAYKFKDEGGAKKFHHALNSTVLQDAERHAQFADKKSKREKDRAAKNKKPAPAPAPQPVQTGTKKKPAA